MTTTFDALFQNKPSDASRSSDSSPDVHSACARGLHGTARPRPCNAAGGGASGGRRRVAQVVRVITVGERSKAGSSLAPHARPDGKMAIRQAACLLSKNANTRERERDRLIVRTFFVGGDNERSGLQTPSFRIFCIQAIGRVNRVQ